MAEYEHKDWDGRTDGTPWMQRSLIGLFRILPLWLMYGVMALVIPFYMLFDRRAFKASYSFFRNRIGRGPVCSFFSVYAAEFHLGQVVLDRFASYAGKKFDLRIDGFEIFRELVEGEDGFVQLSSHMGNYEMAGYSLRTENKKLHALVVKETETVMKNRARMFSRTNIEMVPLSEDLSHIFTLNSALADGHIVSMAGDRVFGSQKRLTCKFFGENADFPAGPFILAAQRGVPMISVFVMKEGLKRYHIYVGRIDNEETDRLKRMEKASALAASFVSRMEEMVRMYPTQWYNFFDFWKQ